MLRTRGVLASVAYAHPQPGFVVFDEREAAGLYFTLISTYLSDGCGKGKGKGKGRLASLRLFAWMDGNRGKTDPIPPARLLAFYFPSTYLYTIYLPFWDIAGEEGG